MIQQSQPVTVTGKVTCNSTIPIVGASVEWGGQTTRTDGGGEFSLSLSPGTVVTTAVTIEAFGITHQETVTVPGPLPQPVNLFDVDIIAQIVPTARAVTDSVVTEGEVVKLDLDAKPILGSKGTFEAQRYTWRYSGKLVGGEESNQQRVIYWDTSGLSGPQKIAVTAIDKEGACFTVEELFQVVPRPQVHLAPATIGLRRTSAPETEDVALWVVIRKSTEAMSFHKASYSRFVDLVLCGKDGEIQNKYKDANDKFERMRNKRFLPYSDADAYRLLKVATEAFVMVTCAVRLDGARFGFDSKDLAELANRTDMTMSAGDLETLWTKYLVLVNGAADRTLPYLALVRQKLKDAGLTDLLKIDIDAELPTGCIGIVKQKLMNPCLLELIWSYWHEEGMLVQTMNAICRRFQNIGAPYGNDPLANLDIDPLRPLNNLLWGYIQDEQHRLTVVRRAYEYNHQYGITLYGKAVPQLRPADARSKFFEAFHNLLYLCTVFFKQSDDTTVVPDGFPVLNALKEVHLLLSEGAHNQFGDLTTTARIEMLMQQWLLARPEFREFLPTRIMVAYPEPWMDRVDAMKKLQGWTDVSVLHFRDLAVFGEQILLGIRYGAWSDINDPVQAANWARFWRPEIQGYIHAYRAVTGVDLTAEISDSQRASLRAAQPSALLAQRLQSGNAMPMLPGATGQVPVHQGFRQRRAARR